MKLIYRKIKKRVGDYVYDIIIVILLKFKAFDKDRRFH